MKNTPGMRLVFFGVMLAVSCAAPCRGGTETYRDAALFDENDQQRLAETIENRWLPAVAEVKLSPEQPGPDEDVSITVRTQKNKKNREEDLIEVAVYYSADGGETWEEEYLENEKANIWTGEIPGMPSGAEVLYGIRIVDISGGSYMETPCRASENPAEQKDYPGEDCAASPDSGICEDRLPSGSMFPIGTKESAAGDGGDAVPGDLNLIDMRIGCDEETVFLDYTFAEDLPGKGEQGQAGQGRMSPMYNTALVMPEKDETGTGIDVVLRSGGVLGYSPMGLIKCSLDFRAGEGISNRTDGIECRVINNHLMFAFPRDVFGNSAQELSFMAMSALAVDPDQARKYDYSPLTITKDEVESNTVENDVCLGPSMSCSNLSGEQVCITIPKQCMKIDTFERTRVTKTYEIDMYEGTPAGKLFDGRAFTRVRFITRSVEVQ